MRAYALEASIDEFPEAPFLEWTFEPPISEFSYRNDEGNVGTEPAVIEDPVAASALRAAWLETQELSEQEDFSPDFVAARDGAGVTYRVYARDVLPFEDPEGWGVELPEP